MLALWNFRLYVIGIFYVVLDRKPRKKDFQFYSGNFNKLILLDFFNPKSAIKNLKSCLNGLFVQALVMLFFQLPLEVLAC